jgi:hypothetical protein
MTLPNKPRSAPAPSSSRPKTVANADEERLTDAKILEIKDLDEETERKILREYDLYFNTSE